MTPWTCCPAARAFGALALTTLATAASWTLATEALTRSAGEPAVSMVEVTGEGATYWSRWRGPSGQGLVKEASYTDTWSDTENVRWKTEVPGLGHSSPIVWKNHIFLTTSYDDGRASILAFDKADGKPLWETFIPDTTDEHIYQKNRHASPTAFDRWTPRLRLVRQQGTRRRRFHGQAGLAPVAGHVRQLPRHGRLAAPVQGSARSSFRIIAAAPRAARSSAPSTRRPARSCGARHGRRRSGGARRWRCASTP